MDGPDEQVDQRDLIGQRWQHVRCAKQIPSYKRSDSE